MNGLKNLLIIGTFVIFSPNDSTGQPLQNDTRESNPFTTTITGALDDPEALPGQIIIAGSRPGYLKYNGIPGPAYLCGPDNPETFLFGSGQEEAIKGMAEAGVSAFHCMMWRMKKGNMKGEGDDTHSPFIDHDPSKGLDPEVLNKWDRWLGLLEQAGITVHLDFYNDATDVEQIGWKLDTDGNLHPDEHRFITGIVNKFKHHKNIIWGLEESANKPPRSRVPHFKKMAEVIAETDNHNHPIHIGFVVTDDPEGDDPENPATPDDYRNDPNIGIVSWLHVPPNGDDFEAQYQEYLQYYRRDSRHFIVMKNETFHHPRDSKSRKYMWSATMAGLQNLEAYHHANDPKHATLMAEDGFLASFMRKTDYHTMQPRNDLSAGSTKWVLANPGHSYILYTYAYQNNMGVKGLLDGTYDLLWLDTETGETVNERGQRAKGGEKTWEKPQSIGDEVALYIKKLY